MKRITALTTKDSPKLSIGYKAFILISIGFTLPGCATTDSQTTPSERSAQLNTDKSNKGLSPRVLKDGECGLFVWTGEDKTFVLFSQNGTTARFSRGGEEIKLTSAPSNDPDEYGQAPQQILRDASNNEYELSLGDPKKIEQGIEYTQGRFSFKNEEGWYVVQSAFGVSTCLTNTSSEQSLFFKPRRRIES